MTGVRKLEHLKLRVEDLEAATAFYTGVVGLVEIDRAPGTVYLGTVGDDGYDVALTEGGTGLEHFAVRVPDETTLERHEAALEAAGSEAARTDGEEPGQVAGVRFEIPSGVSGELVVVDRDGYRHVTDPLPAADGCGPIDLDHVTLATTDPRADAEFLRDTVGFRISDAVRRGDEEWALAFTRYGDYHHDVGLLGTDDPEPNLFHHAWTFASFDHMKQFADKLARQDHYLEMGMNRHYFGDNLFAYFMTPGGNRFEITAEVATIDESTPTQFHEMGERENTIAAWGGCEFPESMLEGT